MNHLARTLAATIVVLATLASPLADAKARKPNELLQYIPAETPYVMAFTKPFPDDLMDKFEPSMDKMLSAYQRMMRYKLSEQLIVLSAQEGGAEEAERLQAFMDELLGLMSVEGLHDAGIDRDAILAIYGDGILPVLRIAMTEAGKLDAAIARLEAGAEEEFLVGEIDGTSYRYRDFEELRLVIGTFGKDAVVAVVPAKYGDERLAQTLGIEKPRNSLAKSKDLTKIAKQYGFTEHFVSFIDIERIAATFTGDPSGLNAEFLQLAGVDAEEIPAECRSEVEQLASVMPRIVMGYTKVDSEIMETGLIAELRNDIALGLASLPTAVPGLGADLGGLFSFGFSLDMLAARAFYEARIDAIEADPYECMYFADLNESAVKGRAALAQPLPPVVYSFRGMLANVTGIEGMDFASEQPPESIDASLLIAIENAQDLVMMAAMMSPEIAALNLLPDGKARALDLPQLATMAKEAFAALSESGVSVAMGEGAQDQAEALLTADVADSKPFMSFSMDAKKYYDFVGQAVMEGDDDEEGEPTPEAMKIAISDIMTASGELYERMAINVHLTERGVEVSSKLTLVQ